MLVGSPETQVMPYTFPRRADSQSTPIQTPSQSKRRRRRAKKAVLLATPRITNWFPRTPLKIPDTPEDTPKQATPPPTIPSKIKKRASRKKKDAPSPILGSPSPRRAAGSAPVLEKAHAKMTSLGYQTTSKSKEDLVPKNERSQPSPNPSCHMERAVQS